MIRTATVLAAALFAGSALAAEPAATLSDYEGTVLVNAGEKFVTAEAGQALNPGDRVMVMEGARAELTFTDGCALPLESGSLLVVPAISTCAGGIASIERIGPSYAQAVGAPSYEDDDGEPPLFYWSVGLAGALIIYDIVETEREIVSP